MSPQTTGRSAWNSTKWLWILLAICLIGWRVSSRIEQYHPSLVGVGRQAQVTFFDANERNTALIDASRSQSDVLSKHTGRVLPIAEVKVAFHPACTSVWEVRTELPPSYVDSVTLFSNPPPPFLS